MRSNQLRAPAVHAQPRLLAALDAAIAEGGATALDPTVPEAIWTAALVGPAAAFLVRPGKDIRARLVRAGWMIGGAPALELPEPLEHAIELLHAGSLIIDDVEDAGDVRRGAPALHRIVGEPLAINTGSWMYFWGLAELDRARVPGGLALAITALVRCHQGQALDLATRVTELEARTVPAVVAATTRLKTGALCRLAIELGALAAGAPTERVAAAGALGEAAGGALQMLDDLGCLVAEDRRAKACEDLRAGRATWAWAWLAEQDDALAWARLAAESRAVAGGADPSSLVAALATRVEETGRARIRAVLDRALDDIAAAVGPSPVVDAIAGELRRMETMYG